MISRCCLIFFRACLVFVSPRQNLDVVDVQPLVSRNLTGKHPRVGGVASRGGPGFRAVVGTCVARGNRLLALKSQRTSHRPETLVRGVRLRLPIP